MKKTWIRLIIGVAVVIFLSTVLFTIKQEKQPQIVIGHIAPLTGDAGVWGQWAKDGIEVGIKEINNKGGINGKEVVVIHEDTQGKPEEAVAALKKLINVNGVQAIIGDITSSGTLACAPIAEQTPFIINQANRTSNNTSHLPKYIK